VGVIGSLLIAGIYTWFVRTHPHAGMGLDLLQMALWASSWLGIVLLTAFAVYLQGTLSIEQVS